MNNTTTDQTVFTSLSRRAACPATIDSQQQHRSAHSSLLFWLFLSDRNSYADISGHRSYATSPHVPTKTKQPNNQEIARPNENMAGILASAKGKKNPEYRQRSVCSLYTQNVCTLYPHALQEKAIKLWPARCEDMS